VAAAPGVASRIGLALTREVDATPDPSADGKT
jgi:hypothetical protein